MTVHAFRDMSDLEVLVERLRAEQHFLMLEAKASEPFQRADILKRITELEAKIQAVEVLIEDR